VFEVAEICIDLLLLRRKRRRPSGAKPARDNRGDCKNRVNYIADQLFLKSVQFRHQQDNV
jgi:hypothetical protein